MTRGCSVMPQESIACKAQYVDVTAGGDRVVMPESVIRRRHHGIAKPKVST